MVVLVLNGVAECQTTVVPWMYSWSDWFTYTKTF